MGPYRAHEIQYSNEVHGFTAVKSTKYQNIL